MDFLYFTVAALGLQCPVIQFSLFLFDKTALALYFPRCFAARYSIKVYSGHAMRIAHSYGQTSAEGKPGIYSVSISKHSSTAPAPTNFQFRMR